MNLYLIVSVSIIGIFLVVLLINNIIKLLSSFSIKNYNNLVHILSKKAHTDLSNYEIKILKPPVVQDYAGSNIDNLILIFKNYNVLKSNLKTFEKIEKLSKLTLLYDITGAEIYYKSLKSDIINLFFKKLKKQYPNDLAKILIGSSCIKIENDDLYYFNTYRYIAVCGIEKNLLIIRKFLIDDVGLSLRHIDTHYSETLDSALTINTNYHRRWKYEKKNGGPDLRRLDNFQYYCIKKLTYRLTMQFNEFDANIDICVSDINEIKLLNDIIKIANISELFCSCNNLFDAQGMLDFYNLRVQETIFEVDLMGGICFENFCKELIEKYYNVDCSVTLKSNDYGADLIFNMNFKKIVVQLKRYKSAVGIRAVNEVIAAKVYYDADEAWVMTNSYFSNQAINLALSDNVRLFTRNDLENIINSINQKSDILIKNNGKRSA